MEERIYSYRNSIVFKKTKEEFGGLSNMAAGYPLIINGVSIRTSEAIYQCCRFPHLPEVQRTIINEKSPMTAKMRSKPHRDKSREDWLDIRIIVMRWCLRVKLFQNWDKFSTLLKSTGDLPIVEESNRDSFWGAKPEGNYLKGTNCLGRLLMELRDELPFLEKQEKLILNPPKVAHFLLLNKEIESIVHINRSMYKPIVPELDTEPEQISLFESVNDIQTKFPNSDNVINIVNEMLLGDRRANVGMIDYFVPEEINRDYLLDITNKIINRYRESNNNKSYFLDTILDALLIKDLKVSTKSIFATLLLKLVVTKEHKQKMINHFVSASLFTPNPLGGYLFSVVKKTITPTSYLKYYKQKIVTVARSNSFAALYGKEIEDDAFESIIDAYHNNASTLIMEYVNKPISYVVNEILDNSISTFPVNPFKLCEKLGINVKYINLPMSLEGLTFKNSYSKRGLIVLNENYRGSKREKFTLSHELAHYLLHDFSENELINVNNGYLVNIKNKSEQEREANQFAEMLLIPEGSKGENILKLMEAPFLPKVSKMSEEWAISKSVIISRLIKASVYPIKLSIYKEEEIIYTSHTKYWDFERDLEVGHVEEVKVGSNLTYKLTYFY